MQSELAAHYQAVRMFAGSQTGTYPPSKIANQISPRRHSTFVTLRPMVHSFWQTAYGESEYYWGKIAMKVVGLASVLLSSLILAACAGSSFNYTPPSNISTPKNEIVIDEPFEKVWDRLVKNLSAEFFVVNSIEKASRIINVSIASTEPGRFVDCGHSRRTFTNVRGGQQVYNYATADSAIYSITNEQGYPFSVSRQTSLDGRTNIYVAPEASKTVIRVNTRYIVKAKVETVRRGGFGRSSHSTTWSFNTKEVFVKTLPGPGVTIKCVALGILETKILQAGRPDT